MNEDNKITVEMLEQFFGSEGFYRYSPLFPKMTLTDGTLFVAEKAGAFWLMDAICSHQRTALKHDSLNDFQLWTLKVDQKKMSAVLECRADSDQPVLVRQRIQFTDFPLQEIKFYVCNQGDGYRTIMLPSEY